MKINSLKYKNKQTNWSLERTAFGGITLLVGVSGVGKTKILEAILNLKNIILGEKTISRNLSPLNVFVRENKKLEGIKWELDLGIQNQNYIWKGEIEGKKANANHTGGFPRILHEELWINDQLIYTREENTVIYEGKELPKISPAKSVLNIFTEEPKIKPLVDDFKKIYFMNSEENYFFAPVSTVQEIGEMLPDLEKDKIIKGILGAAVPIIIKLAFVYEYLPELFDEIKQEFIEVFEQVEDVKFGKYQNVDMGERFYFLQVKEKGTNWIHQNSLSSGMYKTLMHIASVKLIDNDSVVLIDEFENSFGVNCIDVVAGSISNNERRIQYIITSHHPYIINNIYTENWKIVMREGSRVFTRSAAELNLGKSRHEAFKQLINSKEYSGGIL